MNTNNNNLEKTIIFGIAFISPFLSIFLIIYWLASESAIKTILMEYPLVFIWAITTHSSVSSGVTKNKICKYILLSSNFLVVFFFTITLPFYLYFFLIFHPLTLTVIFCWYAFFYIMIDSPALRMLQNLIVPPWILSLAYFFMILFGIDHFLFLLYFSFAVLYILSAYFSVKQNVNIYGGFGILTKNVIPVWLSVIVAIFCLAIFNVISQGNAVIWKGSDVTWSGIFAILTAIIVDRTTAYITRKNNQRIKNIINTVFDENSFADTQGVNSATNLVQIINFNKGICVVFNKQTGNFLIISLPQNKIIGFDYSDFAAMETGGTGKRRMTLKFHDKNNPQFSIFSATVPEVAQQIKSTYPANRMNGFRQHVQHIINEKFPGNHYRMT